MSPLLHNAELCGGTSAMSEMLCSNAAKEITMDNKEKTAREIAQELKATGMRCNCDLDNWEPEQSTGHSWVCRIHKTAIERKNYPCTETAKA